MKMRKLEGLKKEEMTKIEINIDEIAKKSKEVMTIETFVNKIEETNPKKYEWKEEKEVGRKSYDGKIMYKMIIYCFSRGIVGSRSIVRESEVNIELMWLTGCITPQYRTLVNFVNEKGEAINEMLTEFTGFLEMFGYIGKEVVIDGTKIKGNTRIKNYSENKLKRKVQTLKKEKKEYIEKCKEKDKEEDEKEQRMKIEQFIRDIDKYELKRVELKKVLEEKGINPEENKDLKISFNDADARLLKINDRYSMGYNAQIVMDLKNKFIVGNRITQEGNDATSLEPVIRSVMNETGLRFERVLADAGYYKVSQIKSLEESGIDCFVKIPPKKESEVVFTYDIENDEYTCKNEKVLKKMKSIKKGDGDNEYFQYKTKECKDCPFKEKCKKSKKDEKVLLVNLDADFIDAFSEKICSPSSVEILKQRPFIEHINGTLKNKIGRKGFLISGIQKVQNVFNFFVLSYNIKHLVNISNFDDLIPQLEIYFEFRKHQEELKNALLFHYIFFNLFDFSHYFVKQIFIFRIYFHYCTLSDEPCKWDN
jgi:transposase